MSIDLSSVKAFVEDQVMSDECIITRDSAGSKDDEWDPDTGEYTQVVPPVTIYEGKCYVGGSWEPSDTTEGGAEARIEVYFLNIPLEEGPVRNGDRATVTRSLRNPHLEGVEFICGGHDLGTHKVKQKIPIQRVMRKGQR